MLKINLKIYSTHINILNIKLSYLSSFFKIYNLYFTYGINSKGLKSINLLKAPHIHKKAWRKYFDNNVYILYIELKIDDMNIYKKLITLLQVVSHNISIKVNIKQIP